jgi:hypothetical protein
MDQNELDGKVKLLKEELAAGRLKLHSPDLVESLKRIREGPDGKVNPDTVDGRVRALANAVAFRRHHEDLKQTSLRDVQRMYFDTLDRFFGKPFAEMKKYAASPPEVASQLVSNDKFVEAFKSESGEFAAGNIPLSVVTCHLGPTDKDQAETRA